MKMTAREALILLAVAVLAFGGYTWQQRRQGALTEKLAQNAAHIATLDSSLKVERAKFTVDTVKLFRRITRTDTLLTELVKSDTLRLFDTVKVTVEVVREAVATLNACRETVRSCGELRALEQRRADSLNVRLRLMEKQRPSAFGNTLRAVGYGLMGYGAAKIIR